MTALAPDTLAPSARRPDPMVPALGRVRRRRNETHDTFTLEIEPPGGRPFGFAPGQFNMLYVFGVGEVPISISGDADAPETLVHTIRAVGTVTRALQGLRPGDYLGVRGPFGRGWPVEAAEGRDVLVVAGGIGLAPLRPVVYHLLAHRDRYREVTLLYGARTPTDILYFRELRQWDARRDTTVHVTVDRATSAWDADVGVITPLLRRAAFDPAETVAMICGPEIMMHVTARELHRRGVGSGQIYMSMERNMKCGIGLCGHCQYAPYFICRDGPVFRFDRIESYFNVRAL